MSFSFVALRLYIRAAVSKIEEQALKSRDADTMNKVADYYEKICEHAKATRCKSVAKNFG